MKFRIKNWHEHQHYTKRNPPWIKLKVEMLSSRDWVMWSDASRALAVACMNRLFNLQGEPFGDKRQAAFVDELSESGLPLGAVIAGIRSLVKENLTKIKFTTVLDAAHRHVAPEEVGQACTHCYDGIILMRDEKHREFSLGCTCVRGGQRAKSLEIGRWNGEPTQYRRGRTLWSMSKVPTGVPDVQP